MTIPMPLRKALKKAVRFLPVILFAAVLVFSGITAWHFAFHITDSDAAAELVLGKLLADQNKIVTSDWQYGNEIRLFSTNLVYMPLFKLFSDWHTVRFLSILTFQALLALSYYYLSRRMKIGRNAFFLSASLMLLPVSVVYGRIGLYHNFYMPCFIYGFFIAGLYLSVLEHRGGKRRWQTFRLAALLLLSLLSCMNGFRQLPATMVPLLMTALLTALKERRGAPQTLAEIPGRGWRTIGLAGAVFLAGVLGLYIHTHVLSQYFKFILKDNSVILLPTVANLRNLLVGYLSLFGFQEGRALFSAEGILALCGAFAGAALLFVSLGDLVPRKKPDRFPGPFMGTFYPVAMLCMTFTFLVLYGNENYPQYYLPAFLWIVPYLGLQADRMPKSAKRLSLKQSLVILSCVCLLGNGIYNNLYYLDPDDKRVDYDILIEIDQWDHFDGVREFIRENELELGYATFWNAYCLTEVSNGEIPMISLIREYFPNNYIYHFALISKQCFDLSYVEDKSVFLLVDYFESFIFCETDLAQYSVPVYEDDYYRIYTFDFASDVWQYLLDKATAYGRLDVLDRVSEQEE